jgi:hypothetical protein
LARRSSFNELLVFYVIRLRRIERYWFYEPRGAATFKRFSLLAVGERRRE